VLHYVSGRRRIAEIRNAVVDAVSSFDATAVTPGRSGTQKYVLESPPVVLYWKRIDATVRPVSRVVAHAARKPPRVLIGKFFVLVRELYRDSALPFRAQAYIGWRPCGMGIGWVMRGKRCSIPRDRI
jgi:hypothetical protein